jgi:hypothetical protein
LNELGKAAMPRIGASYCPKCDEYGTTPDPIVDKATFVVVRCGNSKCGHVWKSRSKHELKWARIRAHEVKVSAMSA